MANNEQKTIQIRRQAILDFVKVKKSASREEIQDFIAANKGIAKQGKTKSAVYAKALDPDAGPKYRSYVPFWA
ncbi:hypothetical protein LQZ19_16035 [Treponema primitia]|uniref:hypothetical protein n=1 Tax=Treponema primitia TaxID=88058 RepID=UPI003980D684